MNRESLSKLLMLSLYFGLGGCDGHDPGGEAASPEAQIRQRLEEFLPQAVEEFVRGMGSGRDRWEGKWATRELLAMIEGEGRRADAYYEGLEYGSGNPAELKPPTPRSFWLPIRAEGTYTFEIGSIVTGEGDRAKVTVNFTATDYDGKTYPEPQVVYRMRLEDAAWRIDDVLHGEKWRYSVRGFLRRKDYMGLWPEDGQE